MAAIRCKRSSMVGALALVLWALAHVSLCSAGISTHSEIDVEITPPNLPTVPLPELPHFSLPQIAVPPLPKFSLPKGPPVGFPPLPSRVDFPALSVHPFSLPPLPLNFPEAKLPPVPQPKVSLPPFPGVKFPPTILAPPLPALKTPPISFPPVSAFKAPPTVNPSGITFPGLTTPPVSLPRATATFPTNGRRVGPGPAKK